ncbi:MAG: uncharacterized membrane protein YgdD (TMEM256/DUF423 family) [Gammaproteobacteria bacterium]
MVLSGIAVLGAVTPLGGIALITGWVLLASAAWRAHISPYDVSH